MLQFSIHRFLCTIVRQSHASACGTALRTGACRAIVVSSRLQSFASRGPLSASLSSPSEPAPAPSTVPAPEVAKIVFVAGISFSGSTLTGLLLGSRPNAIFGGEHSAHYYFADFWNADTGMLAALHVLAALGEQDGPLSGLLAEYDRYAGSGEINSTVADQSDRLAAIRSAYENREDITLDDLDGLTVSATDWWFNVRPSNTEPLLRLNAEARDETTMAKVRDEVLAIIRA